MIDSTRPSQADEKKKKLATLPTNVWLVWETDEDGEQTDVFVFDKYGTAMGWVMHRAWEVYNALEDKPVFTPKEVNYLYLRDWFNRYSRTYIRVIDTEIIDKYALERMKRL